MARSRKYPTDMLEPDRRGRAPYPSAHPQANNRDINTISAPIDEDREALILGLTETYNRVQTTHMNERRARLLQWAQWAP
ncbi:MAG: hypothetical protein ABJ275_02035 [Maricaulaceae bacterium]